MKIVIDKFVITNSEGIGKFDLSKRTTLKSGKRAGKQLEVGEAYGTSFKRCIQIILQYRLDKGLEDISLEKFLDEYESITNKLFEDIEEALNKVEK